jgi:hypothetical protein
MPRPRHFGIFPRGSVENGNTRRMDARLTTSAQPWILLAQLASNHSIALAGPRHRQIGPSSLSGRDWMMYTEPISRAPSRVNCPDQTRGNGPNQNRNWWLGRRPASPQPRNLIPLRHQSRSPRPSDHRGAAIPARGALPVSLQHLDHSGLSRPPPYTKTIARAGVFCEGEQAWMKPARWGPRGIAAGLFPYHHTSTHRVRWLVYQFLGAGLVRPKTCERGNTCIFTRLCPGPPPAIAPVSML